MDYRPHSIDSFSTDFIDDDVDMSSWDYCDPNTYSQQNSSTSFTAHSMNTHPWSVLGNAPASSYDDGMSTHEDFGASYATSSCDQSVPQRYTPTPSSFPYNSPSYRSPSPPSGDEEEPFVGDNACSDSDQSRARVQTVTSSARLEDNAASTSSAATNARSGKKSGKKGDGIRFVCNAILKDEHGIERVCAEDFGIESALTKHQARASHTPPYGCDVCGDALTTSSDLERHQVSKHNKYPKQGVWICFLDHSQSHYRRRNNNEKSLIWTTRRDNFRDHVRRHARSDKHLDVEETIKRAHHKHPPDDSRRPSASTGSDRADSCSVGSYHDPPMTRPLLNQAPRDRRLIGTPQPCGRPDYRHSSHRNQSVASTASSSSRTRSHVPSSRTSESTGTGSSGAKRRREPMMVIRESEGPLTSANRVRKQYHSQTLSYPAQWRHGRGSTGLAVAQVRQGLESQGSVGVASSSYSMIETRHDDRRSRCDAPQQYTSEYGNFVVGTSHGSMPHPPHDPLVGYSAISGRAAMDQARNCSTGPSQIDSITSRARDVNDQSGQLSSEAAMTTGSIAPEETARDGRYHCPQSGCNSSFPSKSNLQKHIVRHEKPFACTFSNCPNRKGFGSKHDWSRHEESQHLASSEQSRYDATTFPPKRVDAYALSHLKPGDEFWCGFCNKMIRIENDVENALKERFDHVGKHFFPERLSIEHWVVSKGGCAKGKPCERSGQSALIANAIDCSEILDAEGDLEEVDESFGEAYDYQGLSQHMLHTSLR